MGFPKRPGVSDFRRRERQDGKVLIGTKLESLTRRSLAEVAREFAIFTHALWFVKGGLDCDPIEDYIREKNPRHRPVILTLQKPLFANLQGNIGGIYTERFNHMVLACPKAGWPSLKGFLASVGLSNPDTRQFFRTVVQEVQVPDTILISHLNAYPTPKLVPTVPVTVFGIDGIDGYWTLRPSPYSPIGCPMPVWLPPSHETRLLGLGVLGEIENPYAIIELGSDQEFISSVDTASVGKLIDEVRALPDDDVAIIYGTDDV